MKAWIREVKGEFRSVNRDSYPELAATVLMNLRESPTPFADACATLSFMFRGAGEHYMLEQIMGDEPLRRLIIDHALIDSINVSSRTIREFTRQLSQSQDLAYNDALFDRMFDFEVRKSGQDARISTILATSTVSPDKLHKAITSLKLMERAINDPVEATTTAYSALDLLADNDLCSMRTHHDLLCVMTYENPCEGENSSKAFEAWIGIIHQLEKENKLDDPATQGQRFMLLSVYHALSKDHEFELSGLKLLAEERCQRWRNRTRISVDELGGLIETEAQMALAKIILRGHDLTDLSSPNADSISESCRRAE